MKRTTAITVASLTAALWSPTVATADPVSPQPDTPCASNLSDVRTWPPGAKMPLVCRAQQWQLVATPQPPNDRWLSFGPPIMLHGEGLRHPDVASGNWTATPLNDETACRAEQLAVIPGFAAGRPPRVDQGDAGRP
jgi:hypothetical protein